MKNMSFNNNITDLLVPTTAESYVFWHCMCEVGRGSHVQFRIKTFH
jgi:hypothetical protein